MMSQTRKPLLAFALVGWALTLVLFIVNLLGLTLGSRNAAKRGVPPGTLLTNQKFIKGLYHDLDLKDPKSVFRHVFSHLEDEVTIYPTENYYYFRFPARGKAIWGSLSLFAENRDQGVIGFGYSEHNDNPNLPDGLDRAGGGGSYSAADGVVVKKLDIFKYAVSFEGRTVTFELHDVGVSPPQKARLRPEEVFVGPIFDESGLKFFLIFNRDTSRLYILLNEDGFVPEDFRRLTSDIILGERTGFAFYVDGENSRKILIAVQGENVLKNNWYDGPFDQMPDNYVHTGKIPNYQTYIESNYPGLKGRIDKYGNYLHEKGARVAVAPYLVYFSTQDVIAVVESCKALGAARAQFYSCITRQVFQVPENKHHLFSSVRSDREEYETGRVRAWRPSTLRGLGLQAATGQ